MDNTNNTSACLISESVRRGLYVGLTIGLLAWLASQIVPESIPPIGLTDKTKVASIVGALGFTVFALFIMKQDGFPKWLGNNILSIPAIATMVAMFFVFYGLINESGFDSVFYEMFDFICALNSGWENCCVTTEKMKIEGPLGATRRARS